MKIIHHRTWAGLPLLLLMGCFTPGPLQIEEIDVAGDGVSMARYELEMGSGELALERGGPGLLRGICQYNVEAWRPILTKSEEDRPVLVRLSQEGSLRGIPLGEVRNEWDLQIGDSVLSDLQVDVGAGECRLDLADLKIENLHVTIGAGEARIDLRGPWNNDLTARIEGGVGSIVLFLPRDTGVRVRTSVGLGDTDSDLLDEGDYYVNEAFGEAAHSLLIDVDLGLGSIELHMVD